MVKSVIQKQQHENGVSSSSCKYKGVRKRKWGKYVSEIRLPNSRERIWLGSYDTAEKAARAFDAALFCLRGRTAKFNFPDNPPDIVNGRSLTPAEIQVAAAEFAKLETRISHSGLGLGRVEDLDPGYSCSLSSSELHVNSPCPSISNGVVPLEDEMTKIPLDTAFLDTLTTMGPGVNNIADYGIFPGFDDFSGDLCLPPLAIVDYGDENCDYFCSQGSYLWNF